MNVESKKFVFFDVLQNSRTADENVWSLSQFGTVKLRVFANADDKLSW